MSRMRFDVPEISCEHCRNSLESAFGPVAGVHQVSVDIDAKTVSVSYAPESVDAARLVEVIEERGYDVRQFSEVS